MDKTFLRILEELVRSVGLSTEPLPLTMRAMQTYLQA